MMPKATDEQRATMAERFGGSGIDDGPPYGYLMERGWNDRGGLLLPPEGHEPGQLELECVWFLCDEWDYGYEPTNGQLAAAKCWGAPDNRIEFVALLLEPEFTLNEIHIAQENVLR